MSLLEGDVYRSPGRDPDATPIPLPSSRRLLSPLGWGLAALLALLGPLVAFNALFDPDASNGHRELRLVPAVETLQDVVMVLLLATVVVTIGVLARRGVPIWGGLGRWSRGLYVAALLGIHTAATLGAEVAVFASRGGLHLFEPALTGSTSLPDGRTAHVYASGMFGATYDVYVAERHAIVMRRQLRVARGKLESVTPSVRVNADGSLELVDASGQRLEPQSPQPLLGIGGGC